MYDPYSHFEHAVLPNGLNVYCLEQDKSFVAVEMLVRAGAREDFTGKEGLAHYVEHMVSRNARRYPSYSANKDWFKSTGGSVAFGKTGLTHTGYDFKVPAEDALKAFDIFGSILLDGELSCFIEDQRSVILREYGQSFPTKLKEKIRFFDYRAFFPKSRRAHSTALGTKDTIEKMEQRDLQSFYDLYYVPANIDIVCAGGLSLNELLTVLNKTQFAQSKLGISHDPRPIFEEASRPQQREECLKLSDYMKEAEALAAYHRAIALPKGTGRFLTIGTTNVLYHLLFEQVREARSLAYQVGIKQHHDESADMISIDLAVAPDSLDLIDPLVTDCLKTMLEMEAKLEDYKQAELKGYKLADSSSARIAENAAYDLANFGKIITYSESAELIAAVTWEKARPVIESMLDETRNVTLLASP